MSTSVVKILVVDDEPPIRKLLRVGLTAEGYAMVEAENAEQAIALVAQEKPDLILLDLGLPDVSGHDLLERWRSELMELPMSHFFKTNYHSINKFNKRRKNC